LLVNKSVCGVQNHDHKSQSMIIAWKSYAQSFEKVIKLNSELKDHN